MLKVLRLVAVAFAALAVAVASPAKAAPITSTETFVFTGECVDCPLVGGKNVTVTADLTLQNYVQGTEFGLPNFVSFTYNGSNLLSAFTITDAFSASGFIPLDLPAAANVLIEEGVAPFKTFQSTTLGTWEVGTISDFGIQGTWGVPEPPSLALLAVSLLGFGLLLRRGARAVPS